MTRKKIVALFLAATMSVSVLTVFPGVLVFADENDDVVEQPIEDVVDSQEPIDLDEESDVIFTETEVEETCNFIESNSIDGIITRSEIDSICQQYGFSDGRYWTYDYTNLDNSVGTLDDAAQTGFSASDTPYGSVYGSALRSTMHKGEYYYNGYRQCWGFAEFIGRELTAQSPTNSWAHLSLEDLNNSGGIQIGDVIHTSGHTAIVISVSGEEFEVIECRGSENSKNVIRIGKFNGSYNTIESIPGLEWVARYQFTPVDDSIKTPDDLMAALYAASKSDVQQTITIGADISLSISNYLDVYNDSDFISQGDYYTNGGGHYPTYTLSLRNVRIVGVNGATGSIRFNGGHDIVTVHDDVSIELGPEISPLNVQANNSYYNKWFYVGWTLNNNGRIRNASAQILNNYYSGNIVMFISNRFNSYTSTLYDSAQLLNYGSIGWALGVGGSFYNSRNSCNYGKIYDCLMAGGNCKLDNYGQIDNLWSYERYSLRNADFNFSSTTYRYYQYGGITAQSYLNKNDINICGGSIGVADNGYSAPYQYSITVSELDWNQSTGVKRYTSEQNAAIVWLRGMCANEYSWYSLDSNGNITGNITFNFTVNSGSWLDESILEVSSRLVNCFSKYSMNIYTDCTVTNLQNGNVNLELNGCTVTFDGESLSLINNNHMVFSNGRIIFNRPTTITSPNTLVLNNVCIELGDAISGTPFICDNGRVVFNNCSSADGSPIEVQLNSNSDTVEIISTESRSVEYLTGDQVSQGNADFVIRNCADSNGLAAISSATEDDQNSLVVVPDAVRALQTATCGTITLIDDATVGDITLNADSNLVIGDGVTLNVDGTAVINGTVTGTGTINVGNNGNLVRNNTIDSTVTVIEGSSAGETVDMYRLYNPNSGEHFYTADPAERDNLYSLGWNYEGIGWTAPAMSNTPVYRLYNQYGGEHHYTTSVAERDSLVAAGWTYESIGWYSDDARTVPLYRQYNPNAFANNHNYTTSLDENNWLVSLGWRAEDIGWYGVG